MRLQHQAGQARLARQVRVQVPDRPPGRAVRGDRGEFEIGMRGQQPE